MTGRRLLARLAPTWAASPLRRSIQAVCFLGFLLLFFYVCCPYTARPARMWGGWMPAEIDAQSGRATATTEEPPVEPIREGQVVHVVDGGANPPENLGAFRVVEAEARQLVLEPAGKLTLDQLDRLAASIGPWLLREAEPGSWPSHYADDLAAKEVLPAELFLVLDPLVSVSTAVASRSWIGSLTAAAGILVVCLAIPRGFCGYVCPLGTLLDLFDWGVARRIKRFRVTGRGWWMYLKYYLLITVLAASLFGVLLSGFVAAIPVVTRGVAFLLAPLETGLIRGGHQVPPANLGNYVSLAFFFVILGLGFLRPRFWCKFVCPTGAMFSLGNLLRATDRKVGSRCVACNRCMELCPFDAIKDDITTRGVECAFCRTCGGACPTQAIRYTARWSRAEGDLARPDAAADDPKNPRQEAASVPLRQRRSFLGATIGVAAGATGGLAAAAIKVGSAAGDVAPPIRPPGSVPEPDFLAMCVRCGECFRACPNDAIQPLGISHGFDAIWTPQVVADWSGCEPSCNNCGQVCPTGAIRPLPLEEKRAARIGLAIVNPRTCLPHAGQGDCRICVDECAGAGYHAVEFVRVGTVVDAAGEPIEDSGRLAPVVVAEKCVGCGICQTRCRAINAVEKGLIAESAIRVEAGEDREDRLRTGSYVAVREEQRRRRKSQRSPPGKGHDADGYLPEFLDP